MRRLLLALLLPLALAGCAERVWAPDDAVARARYVSPDGPAITLFTVVRTRGGDGAHSGLMIDGSQRILFDPAGTWQSPAAPERNDVFFGLTPQLKKYYIDYHARVAYNVVEQRIPVSAQVAEIAIKRAEEYGAVSKAMCGNAISSVLGGVPGFESIRHSMFPGKIMREFEKLPGVTTTLYTDDDPENNKPLLAQQISTVGRTTVAPVAPPTP